MQIAIAVFFAVLVAASAVQTHRIITSHMVLQAENPTIFGFATPGDNVSVVVSGSPSEKQRAVSDSSGKWLVQLTPRAASFTPVTITISDAKNSTVLEDILYGDVWWCG
jgi:sialate O-acetylesterase